MNIYSRMGNITFIRAATGTMTSSEDNDSSTMKPIYEQHAKKLRASIFSELRIRIKCKMSIVQKPSSKTFCKLFFVCDLKIQSPSTPL
uniref:Putative ovule protein n=1 Tax=Solanum chacoense TaxID=4108 RepID=A0A0V0IU85_SOLCH